MNAAKAILFLILFTTVVVDTVRYRKCALEPRTRAGKYEKHQCSQGKKSHKVDKDLARSTGLSKGDFLCVYHWNKVRQQDRRCSFPKPEQKHHKTLLRIPDRLREAIDELGKGVVNYKRGSKWCSSCKIKGETMLQELDSYKSPLRRRSKVSLFFALFFCLFYLNKY